MIDPHSVGYGAIGGAAGAAGILMLIKDGAREILTGLIEALKHRGERGQQMVGELMGLLRSDLQANRDLLSRIATAQIEATTAIKSLQVHADWTHDVLLEIRGQRNGRTL